MNQRSVITLFMMALLLGLGSTLSACKKKKKSIALDVTPPQFIALKTPRITPSFSTTPTFTVRQVDAGDTVRLFKSADCAEDSLLGSGVAGVGQTNVDITLTELSDLGTYPIYANRTNAAGTTSVCSAQLTSYQLIGCPDGLYAHVEGNPDLGTDAFCVMVTEARQGEGNIPVAQYAGTPWTSVNAINAKAACKSIPVEGGTCDLISNPQWMTLARDIEATDANWSGGEVGVGVLNRGHSDDDPANALSITYPADPWDGTGQTSTTWHQKRTHILSNGEEIWDLAGNVREWADWETGGDTFMVGPNTCPYDGKSPYSFVCEDLAPNDYLPGNPAGIDPAEYTASNYNIGTIYGTNEETRAAGSGGAALRGGYWGPGSVAGLFCLDLRFRPTFTHYSFGFRCVCLVGL